MVADWRVARNEIEDIIRHNERKEMIITDGIQRQHKLRCKHPIRSLGFSSLLTKGQRSDLCVTNYCTVESNYFGVWKVGLGVKYTRLHCPCLISRMICVKRQERRLFVASCNDLYLRVFDSRLKELSASEVFSTILCFVYCQQTDELISGGIGCIHVWKFGILVRDPLTSGRQLQYSIRSDQCIKHMVVDECSKRLLATHQDGVHIISLKSGEEEYFIPNMHTLATTCSAVCSHLGLILTASVDGSIKVWNDIVFRLLHTFTGHVGCVTGLHPLESVVFSSSLDGTIRVWRLKTLEQRNRYDVGHGIEEMHLVGDSRLYCKLKHSICVYQFTLLESFFSYVHSTVVEMRRVSASTGWPARLIVTAEDEGTRLVSPRSGCTLTTVYPISLSQPQDLLDIAYSRTEERMFALLGTKQIVVLSCKTNPCTTEELWSPLVEDDAPLCITMLETLDSAIDRNNANGRAMSLLLAGHSTGKISLIRGQGAWLCENVEAHRYNVVKLVVSSMANTDGSHGQLLSVGTDKFLKLWRLKVVERLPSGCALDLVCIASLSVASMPYHCVLASGTIAVLNDDNRLVMYRPTKSGKMKTLTHSKDNDHSSKVLDLACCSSLLLFATCSRGGSVRIWDKDNVLIRELLFTTAVTAVAFCNERGDLLIGCEKHVSVIPCQRYIPISYLKLLLEMDVTDDFEEMPLPFNSDVEFWYDPDRTPTLPLHFFHHSLTSLPPIREQPPSPHLPAIPSVKSEELTVEPTNGEEIAVTLSTTKHCESKLLPIILPINRRKWTPRHPENIGLTKDQVVCRRRRRIREKDQDRLSVDRVVLLPPRDGYIPNSVIRGLMKRRTSGHRDRCSQQGRYRRRTNQWVRSLKSRLLSQTETESETETPHGESRLGSVEWDGWSLPPLPHLPSVSGLIAQLDALGRSEETNESRSPSPEFDDVGTVDDTSSQTGKKAIRLPPILARKREDTQNETDDKCTWQEEESREIRLTMPSVVIHDDQGQKTIGVGDDDMEKTRQPDEDETESSLSDQFSETASSEETTSVFASNKIVTRGNAKVKTPVSESVDETKRKSKRQAKRQRRSKDVGVADLIEKLSDDNSATRLQAIDSIEALALAGQNCEKMILSLFARMHDSDASVRLSSLRTLEALAEAKERLEIDKLTEKLHVAYDGLHLNNILRTSEVTRSQTSMDTGRETDPLIEQRSGGNPARRLQAVRDAEALVHSDEKNKKLLDILVTTTQTLDENDRQRQDQTMATLSVDQEGSNINEELKERPISSRIRSARISAAVSKVTLELRTTNRHLDGISAASIVQKNVDVLDQGTQSQSQISLDSGRGTLKTTDNGPEQVRLQTKSDFKNIACLIEKLPDAGPSVRLQDLQPRRDSKDPTRLIEKLADANPSVRLQAVENINKIACSDEKSERLLVTLVARTRNSDASVRLRSHQALEALSLVKEMRNIYELREKLRITQDRLQSNNLLDRSDVTHVNGCEDDVSAAHSCLPDRIPARNQYRRVVDNESRVQEWLRNVTPYFVPEEIPEEDSEREDVGVDFPAKRVEEESLYLVQRNLLRRRLQHAKNTLQWNRQSSEKRLKGSERAASPQSSDSSGHTTRHSSYQSAAPLRRGQSKERLSRHTTRNSQHSAVSPMRPQLKERLSSSDGNGHTTRYSNRSAVSLLRRQLKERLSSSEGSSHDSAFSLTRRQLKERLSYNYCLKQCVRGERLVTSLTVPSQQKPVPSLDSHGQSVEALPSMLTIHTTCREGVSHYGLIGMEWISASSDNPAGLQHQMHKDLTTCMKQRGGTFGKTVKHMTMEGTKHPMIKQPHFSAFLFSHFHLCFTEDYKLDKRKIKQLMRSMKCNRKRVSLPQCPPSSATQ